MATTGPAPSPRLRAATYRVQLHAGFSELTTGVSWSSPWPRADARYR